MAFLGPPGSGKGTQARFLTARYGACQVATGDILRKAMQEESPLGIKAKDYIQKGELVPDEIMLNLVSERLREKDCDQGFILDGFPRTVAQADGLGAMLKKLGSRLDCVLALEVPQEIIVQRLSGRRTCRSCGALYHAVFEPPQQKDTCDRCQGELYQREDDREETVRERLRIYKEQTERLIDYYRRKGLLKTVDGVGTVEEVHGRIVQELGRVAR